MRTTSTPGGVFEGLTGEATFNHTLAGRMWQLVLAGPTEGTYEVIYDFRPSEGSTGGEVDNYSYTETLEGTDLDTAGGIVVPLVVDPAGNLSRSSGGAPWYWVLNAGPMDTMSLLGPPFPARPVDVGDTWSAGRIDRALGPMTFSAEIIEEVPRDGGYLFAVEFSGTAEDFPVELSLADAAQLFADAESQAATGSLLAMGEIPGAEITVEVVEVSLEGRYLLDPATGRVEEHESTARIVMNLGLAYEDESMGVRVAVDVGLNLSAHEADEAAGFEIESVLRRFAVDPQALAEQGLAPLVLFKGVELEEGEIDGYLDVLAMTPADLARGLTYAKVGDAGDQTAFVVSIAIGGAYRGAPWLAEALVKYWGNTTSVRWTDVAGRTAYRALVRGRWWLVWANDTHLFAVVAPSAFAETIMTALMEGSPPSYRWRNGDCFDFTDGFEDDPPYAPMGALGMRHCQAPHTWEVLYSFELEEGADEPYPDDLAERVYGMCGAEYFGRFEAAPLEQGLDLLVYLPDREEWEQGARDGTCLIAQYSEDGIVSSEGRLAQEDILSRYDIEVGSCLAGSSLGAVPVPCSVAHRGEVVGVFTDDSPEGAPFPGLDAIRNPMRRQCEQAFSDYGLRWRDRGVEAAPVTDMLIGWDQGIRDWYCVAYDLGEDGWPLDVKGSFLGDWETAEEQLGT